MRVYEERSKANPDLKPATITSRLVALGKLRKTWPELDGMKPTQVTPRAVLDWVIRFKQEGTGYLAKGAKKAQRGNSPSSVNRAIDTLKYVMDIALQRGAIHTNPLTVKPEDGSRLKKRVERTQLSLPSFADVQRIFSQIENNGAKGGWGQEAADFCRFMTYSGARVGEVATVTWESVNWDAKTIHIKGYKSQTSDRVIPLFGDLEDLLKRVQDRRKRTAAVAVNGEPVVEQSEQIFRIGEAQKSINTACAALGVARITHHDFRHLFATRCIEAGVDIPTISRWMGHADGGALAMKIYGHLQREHSDRMAAKVSFVGSVA
jgi:integrase